MVSHLLLPVILVATVLVSVTHATVRCRTGAGRIYIGPSPPAGCEIEATYGASPVAEAPTAGSTPAPASTRTPADDGTPTPPAPAPTVAAPTSVPRGGRAGRRSPGRRAAAIPETAEGPSAGTGAPGGAPRALAAKRASLERALEGVWLELETVERELAERRVDDAAGPGDRAAARLRAEAERRRKLEPLRRRQGELRARRDRIRTEFAELTSRVAVANGGSLPAWWPAELRCGRCP